MVWPIWSVADMVFGCGRYRFAVADIIVGDMVCGRYCHVLLAQTRLRQSHVKVDNNMVAPR